MSPFKVPPRSKRRTFTGRPDAPKAKQKGKLKGKAKGAGAERRKGR